MNLLRLFLSVLILALEFPSAQAAPIESVSSPSRPSRSASGASFTPVFSADSRSIAFVSHANNIVTNDDLATALDVFVYSLDTSNTVLVSVNSTGSGGGMADANRPVLSSNGQFVAFFSSANNMLLNDTNDASDVFLRDVNAGVTSLASATPAGEAPYNRIFTDDLRLSNPFYSRNQPLSGHPQISATGNQVFFNSLAPMLTTLRDDNLQTDVFVQTNRPGRPPKTQLISVNTGGADAGNGPSELCSITPDGRWVAFQSRATDLCPGVSNRIQEIYVRDLQANLTYWVSSNTWSDTDMSPICFGAVLSQDGHFVYFKKLLGFSSNTCEQLWCFDLQSQTTTLLHTNTYPKDLPSISADGNYAAFAAMDGIYLWNGSTNRFIDCGLAPSLSSDGTILAYKQTESTCGTSNTVPGIFVQELNTGVRQRVTQRWDGSPASFEQLSLPALSPDGRFVAFESSDDGIVPIDRNQACDIFLYDRLNQYCSLISQSNGERLAATGTGMSLLSHNCISADGGVVVFSALDSNLADRDTNRCLDVFARNMQSGELIPVSVLPEVMQIPPDNYWVTNAPFKLNRAGLYPAVSGDGRYAAWVWHNPPGSEDVYVRDLVTRTNYELASRDMFNVASGASSQPCLNSNGTLLLFQSRADNLTSYGAMGGITNIYMRSLPEQTNQLISISANGQYGGNAHSWNARFSPDEQWVVFQSKAINLITNGAPGLYARNLAQQKTWLMFTNTSSIPISGYFFSANSRFVAFEINSSCYVHDLLNHTNLVTPGRSPSLSADGQLLVCSLDTKFVFPYERSHWVIAVKNLRTGETNAISPNPDPNGYSILRDVVVSPDGRYIIYALFNESAPESLFSYPKAFSKLYLHDRLLGNTVQVGKETETMTSINRKSTRPIMAADGRTVIFQSFAPDLAPGDYNDTQDIFVLHLGRADSDNDGLDDDWEVAYFGNLLRDGTGNFDGDGQTDRQEFLAGTDPTNQGSVLRVLTLNPITGGPTTVFWSAVPGRTYQVQYKIKLADSTWADLASPVLATGTTASQVDSIPRTAQRFYRVIRKP